MTTGERDPFGFRNLRCPSSDESLPPTRTDPPYITSLRPGGGRPGREQERELAVGLQHADIHVGDVSDALLAGRVLQILLVE